MLLYKIVIVYRENLKDTIKELDFIITPKTKSLAKDLDRVHEKIKKTCSRKAFTDILGEEGQHIAIVAPDWLESCLSHNHLVNIHKFEIRPPIAERILEK